jgi:beta-glucosidase/6-phospho-beta-glucosidase/beta-galactosidase
MIIPFHKKQEAFDKWNADNPAIWKYFEKFAFEVLAKGGKKVSHWLIINRIRWEVYIITSGDDFKISNNNIAFYARLWRKTYPQHKDLFNIKRMVGEPWEEPTQ